MKIVIVGGSAHSTPSLFDTDLPFGESSFSFELVGRSVPHLRAVTRAVHLIAEHRGQAVRCRARSAESLEAALAGADVVVVQFRVGGYQARSWDETFPHRYGLCGDEGLGPGGLAAAWRTWAELERTLASIAGVSPRAAVILLTSPIGILTRCAREAFPELAVYGICELPWTTLQEMCGSAAVNASAATYAYVAVNHLGWFSDTRVGETVVIPPAETRSLKYVRLDDSAADVLREQRAAAPRGFQLESLAARAFEAYESGDYAAVIEAVRRRETPWYDHAIAPLLHAMAGRDTGATFFLTARNDGYCSEFSHDAFIEAPYVVRSGALQRRSTVRWPRADIADKLRRLIAYEACAAAAVRSRDVTRLRTALRLHPWLDGLSISDALVADITARVSAVAATSTR